MPGKQAKDAVLKAPEGFDLSDFEEGGYSQEELSKIMESYEPTLKGIEEGKVIKGKVVRITEDEVFVDISFKSEGIININEFKDPSTLKPGEEIEVYLEEVENQQGQILLSKLRADFMRVWDRIRVSADNNEIVEGRVVRRIKGGLVIDLFGIDAFLPGSQIDLRQVPDMDSLIGQNLKFRIIKINRSRRNVVVSRRVVLEEERRQMRGKLIDKLEKGQILEGTVKNITDFGAFIDLGGVDGLLHITDMSWGRVNHPSEIVALGDKVKIMVLDFNETKDRVSLGMKQLEQPPWDDFEKKYPAGSKVKGKIVSVTDYGAFMELDRGIEGLIHVSEMSWTQHVKHPSKIVEVGDMVEAVVLKIDKENQKISLGLKQLQPDPWENVEQDFPVNSQHKGVVRNLAAFGAFVELREGVDGLVHVSDMSWTRKVSHPSEVVKKGDSVEVVVLSIDKDKRRISLGMKQVQNDPWEQLASQYPAGKEAEGEIVRLLDRGIVVMLDGKVEGFVPAGKLGIENLRKPSDSFKVGDKLMMKVAEFDKSEHRIVLSVEDYYRDRERAEWESYLDQHPVTPTKVGDSVSES